MPRALRIAIWKRQQDMTRNDDQRRLLPVGLQQTDRDARKQAWWTIAYLATVGVALYLVVGSSQAMKAAWLETVFSIITPLVFLGASHVSRRPADRRYPYGYHRWISIAFLCAAAVLSSLGIYVIIDAALKLISGASAEIGRIQLFGIDVWLGWLMLAVLVWSSVPAWFIGRAQKARAQALHDKVLSTDAQMRQADWLTSAAAAIGIAGIAGGWTWVDPVAGAVIGLSILWSGIGRLRHALSDLADSAPTTLERDWDTLPDRVAGRLREYDWILDVNVRLREEGRLIMGGAFIRPASDENLTARIVEATKAVQEMDWRIHDFAIVPVCAIEPRKTTSGAP